MSQTKTQPQMSILGMQPVRMFNSEDGEERAPPRNQIDERIPRYWRDQLMLQGIPDDVTKEQILEKFESYG